MKVALAICLCLLTQAPPLGAAEPRPLLVFPFENQSSRPDLDWLSEGMAEILSSRLASPSRFVLDRADRHAAYEELGLQPVSPLTLASEYEVAQTLGVDFAVLGNFSVSGDDLTIQARWLDVRALKLMPPMGASGKLDDMVDLETNLAWRLLALYAPDFTVGTEQDFSSRFPPVRLDAFENYIRGVLAPDEAGKIRYLTEANQLNPADHLAALQLGRYYFDQKDYDQSAQWLGKLVPSDASYQESRFFLGVDEFFLDHVAAAEAIFSSLAEQVPLGEVANNLGVTEASEGNLREALGNFQRAYDTDPTQANYCFNMAVCFWNLEDYRSAVDYLEKALSANRGDAEVHTLLAAAFQKLGDSQHEKQELDWLSQQEGEEGVQLVQGYVPQTRIEKHYNGRAFRLLALAVQNAEEDRLSHEPPAEQGQAHLKRGESDLAAGHWVDAERELSEAVSLIPNNAEAHLALGRAYEAEGQPKKAAPEIETSLNLKETLAAHLSLARVYLSLNLPKAAHDQSEAALRLDPANAKAKQLLQQIDPKAASGSDQP